MWTNNAFEDGNQSSYIDISKAGTGGNYSLVGLDTLKALKVNEKQITFDRRRRNRKQTYAEALTGNSICWGKNPTVEENQINILFTFNDDNSSGDKILATPEKVEEMSSTKLDNKWIKNARNLRKCKSDKEKIKLKSPRNVLIRIFSGLLEEDQRNSSKISISRPKRIAHVSVYINSSEPSRP